MRFASGCREDRKVRVTGGELRGRRLRVPRGRAVRPSADRVREALFARLGTVEGARVLDLYAGTGALGIEALSRGAREAVFVERSRRIAAVLRENLHELGLEARARLRIGDAVAVLQGLAREGARFDLVLLDPPYASHEAERALRGLTESGILRAGARVVLEAAVKGPSPEAATLRWEGERRYGDTRLLFYAYGERKEASRGPDTSEEV